MSRRVAVLMGGTSTEREVSLRSGAAVLAALDTLGEEGWGIEVGSDVGAVVTRLQARRPDVVFNALHGRFGEDGCIQGVLNLMGLRYTHSGLLASAAAMDKAFARHLFAQAGIPVAQGLVVRKGQVAGDPLPRPYVVKPINEGSSVGVHILRPGDNRAPLIDWPFQGDTVLVEEFVPGREITVAVMGDIALGALEITSERGFYDYDAKYAPGGSHHIMPAPLPAEDYAEACRLAVVAHHALGCRGVSRADLRYDDTRAGERPRFVVLEVNTQPGMTATSLVPDIAAHCGIDFPHLVRWMLDHAECDG